jgi:DNA-binding NtrC family response regulator
MPPRLLVVDTSARWLQLFRERCQHAFDVATCTDFRAARVQLFSAPPELLLTNVRLNAYNGLQLLYLAAEAKLPTRCMLYDDRFDKTIALEAQAIGAFCEQKARLEFVLTPRLHAVLPDRDRRDICRADRRSSCRGGRRAADLASAPVRRTQPAIW